MPKRSAAAVSMVLCGVLAACSSIGVSGSPSVIQTPPAGTPAASASPAPPSSPTSSLATIGQPADDGARIVKAQALGPRARDLTIESPSVGTAMVRILVPSTFADQPTARFPVLLLLHGAGGEYTDWTLNTDVEPLTKPTNFLVVMPEGSTSGIDGWYTNWVTPGEVGQQNWETFHLVELFQLMERNWQASQNRVVAGLSMGGYGSVIYAARRPDLFKATASFSGALDLKTVSEHFNDPHYVARWGDPNVDAANWAAHDPVVLAPKLKGMAVYVSFGNGDPGPFDSGRTDTDKLEAWISQGNEAYVAALQTADVKATVHAYGPGTHSWPYWERELHLSLPMLITAAGATTS